MALAISPLTEPILNSLKTDLNRIEDKVDKLADVVSEHHDQLLVQQTKEALAKRSWNKWIAVLGIVACSGIIETIIHHVWP